MVMRNLDRACEVSHPLLMACVCLLLGSGCASEAMPPGPCQTLECIIGQTREESVAVCTTHLFWYERYPRSVRRQIDATYQYPARSSRSFRDMQRMGYRLPSPAAWCTAYTESRLGTSLAKRTW